MVKMSGPMNFSTSPEQDALVDIARRFGQQHLAPFYQQREREGAFDRPTLREMGRLGFFGVELPAAYGGLGLDCVTAGLVLEALSAADYNIGQLMVAVSLAGTILAKHGDAHVVKPWLKSMLAGEMIPAIALTEPGGGSDAANLAVRARRDGDDYVLDGEKTSTSFATQAGIAVVWRGPALRGAAPTGSAPFSCRWTCPASRQPSSRTSAGGAQDADRCTSTGYGYPHLTCSVRRTVASCR